MSSTLAAVREVTGLRRCPHDHGCKPVEVLPGLWTAHFHDIENGDALRAVSEQITMVINTATEKCPTETGSYGPGVEVLRVEGLLDDPEPRKKVDAMPEGPEKEAAKAGLPDFPAEECAGDAKKDFERVIAAVDAAKSSGGAAMVHCYASLSRSVAFILAYMMKTERLTLVEAARRMRTKWDATWPNDSFVAQLIEYEAELRGADAAAAGALDDAAVGKIHSAIRWNKPREEIREVVTSVGATMEAAAAAADSRNGNTCLHIAAQNGHQDLLRFLLEAGADVNGQNKKGQTPLHMSVEYDFYFNTKLLLDAGADPRKTNADGHEALMGIDGGKTGLDAWDNPVNILKAAGDDKEQLDFALAELEKATGDSVDRAALAQAGMAKKRQSSAGNWDSARFMAIMKAL